MAYDPALVRRIRALLEGTPGLEEKAMFGGLAFLVNGHLAASAYHDGRLLITCSEGEYANFLVEPGSGPMLRSGKPVSGWVLVDAATVANDKALALWVGRGLAHSLSRPPGR
jgi:hypothetical protein